MTTCRTCKHWKPYWTGEAWGVRSFIDAPEAEKIRITNILSDDWEIFPGSNEELEKLGSSYGWERNFQNWPEWGECILTELPSDKSSPNSLAYAMDGSNYMAVLRCHHTFGCVQYVMETDHR